MKTKPVIITISAIILLTCIFFFVRAKYFTKPDANEVTQFLKDFSYQLKGANIDSSLNYFEIGKNKKAITRLIKVLSGKTGLSGTTAPLFQIVLNTDDVKILSANSELTVAEVPVSFIADTISAAQSFITFTIKKVADHKFKILGVNTKAFLKGYTEYAALVLSKKAPEQDTFSPVTLASFKVAQQLKARYDSVLWFDHVGEKTYYYVIKGTLSDKFYFAGDKRADNTQNYKMGLVGSGLKEIIPLEYDLVHNVGGTIDGLVEVEKDGKKGLYNLDGKLVLPVTYDQLFPLNDDANMALLRNGDDYFYLKKDSTVTEKLADFKIADILPKIKTFGDSYTLSGEGTKNIMEPNDRESTTTLVITPSYLVEMGILPQFMNFQNPLRHLSPDEAGDGDGSLTIQLEYNGEKDADGNWFKTAFYSLYDDYLGGRSGLYEGKKVLLVDKKRNRIIGFTADSYYGGAEGGGALSGKCNENSFRAINDTLFEFKTTSEFDQDLLDSHTTIEEGPYYHYLHIQAGKLVALPNQRLFGCTKYVKLDDSYLQGCYVINNQAVDRLTPEVLAYMKNEIFASYGYRFKNPGWTTAFEERFNQYFDDKDKHDKVDDSLTVIDKYNINWLSKKIQSMQQSNKVAMR